MKMFSFKEIIVFMCVRWCNEIKKLLLVEREMGKSYLLTTIIIVKNFNGLVKIFFNNGFKSNKNSFDFWFFILEDRAKYIL